jgi:hypothetical protein
MLGGRGRQDILCRRTIQLGALGRAGCAVQQIAESPRRLGTGGDRDVERGQSVLVSAGAEARDRLVDALHREAGGLACARE